MGKGLGLGGGEGRYFSRGGRRILYGDIAADSVSWGILVDDVPPEVVYSTIAMIHVVCYLLLLPGH